ncbi:MFS transporter [Nocardioides sp. ChNu-153]|uniref:MFS transporter n=1 Tax=unclassified Nocardioides TaxID=2615069 RepID=UPI002407518F|nr:MULTISPECIES: MFS transporter [unclassified Nocardioides]MDF9717034.1 MFS transporter [Nocardioides sp. ChNu-99]MDN7122254.1 MFS transporter [Nocardioides sp. ChNu-153]
MTATFEGHDRGDEDYRRVVLALFAAGFATFAQIFDAQAVLPALARDLDVAPATAALSVSATTTGLAASVLVWAAVSDRVGRTRAMAWSLTAATVLSLVAPLVPGLGAVIALRALTGVALGAVPAVAMAYLNEEVSRAWVPVAAGTYIAGNTIGGIVGRLVAGPVSEAVGWRAGLLAVAVVCAGSTVVFWRVVPVPRGFRPPTDRVSAVRRAARHLRTPALATTYLAGFCLMGAFATVYNYVGFRVSGPPFGVPVTWVSLLFAVYVFGTVASRTSGVLARRHGAPRVVACGGAAVLVALPLLAADHLVVVVLGLAVFTVGIFLAHPVTSALSGQLASVGRAQSTALYQLSWLAGTALVGWAAGHVYDDRGWPATLLVVAGLVVVAVAAVVAGQRPPRDVTPGSGPDGPRAPSS